MSRGYQDRTASFDRVKWTSIAIGVFVGLAMFGAISGCGQPANKQAERQPSAATPATSATDAITEKGPNVEAAEDAVRDDLPDIPIWEGTKFKGVVVSASKVCVDRTVSREHRIEGTGATSHVVVSWPDLEIGEAQDGPCSKAEENADKAIVAARRFFMRMDDLAIQLDEAVGDALDGKSNASAKLRSLKRRIHKINDAYLIDEGESSVGGNLLASSSTAAVNAANDGDIAELARQRREIADARNELADEALN